MNPDIQLKDEGDFIAVFGMTERGEKFCREHPLVGESESIPGVSRTGFRGFTGTKVVALVMGDANRAELSVSLS